MVDAENLDDVAVAAGAEQETSIGRDVEIARVDARRLVAYLGQPARFFFNGEDGYSVIDQSVRGVEEMAVGRQMDVCRAVPAY